MGYNLHMRKKKSSTPPDEPQSVADAVLEIKAKLTQQREVPEIVAIKVHPGGRPTKYNKGVVKTAYDYINSCVDQYYNYQKGFGATNTFERRVSVNFPTREELAMRLSIHIDTLIEWEKKYQEFSEALAFLDQKQKIMVLKGSMNGDYNPMIAKLMLSANHGMKERIDNTSGDKPLEPAQVNITNINTLSNEDLIKLAEGSAS
jgi:hypothetical protein